MSLARRVTLLFATLVAVEANAAPVPPPFDDLRAVPSPAIAGAPVFARTRYTFCTSEASRGSHQVARAGSVVTLTINMDGTGEGCPGVPPPPTDVDYALGSFAAGEYTLIQQTVSAMPGLTYLPLTTTFGVEPAPHHSVPALSPLWLTVLAIVLFGLARSRRITAAAAGRRVR